MFGAITIPYESVMLMHECRLKNNISFADVELAISGTKDIIAGQVFSYTGTFTPEGSVGEQEELTHFLLVTYWKDFSNRNIKETFGDLLEFCPIMLPSKDRRYHLEWKKDEETEMKNHPERFSQGERI